MVFAGCTNRNPLGAVKTPLGIWAAPSLIEGWAFQNAVNARWRVWIHWPPMVWGLFVSYQPLWLLTTSTAENSDHSKSALTITECFRSAGLGSQGDG